MKAKIFVLAASFLLTSVLLSAQENETKEKIKYSNITEIGFNTASPQGVAIEATTNHGVSFNKTHQLGLGLGIGMSYRRGHSNPHMPIFFNYRCYLKPNNTFSPHVNIAAGGLLLLDGVGIYSAITMGFRVGFFSFSSGLSFTPIYEGGNYYIFYEDNQPPTWKSSWYYPFGVTLKVGFAF